MGLNFRPFVKVTSPQVVDAGHAVSVRCWVTGDWQNDQPAYFEPLVELGAGLEVSMQWCKPGKDEVEL